MPQFFISTEIKSIYQLTGLTQKHSNETVDCDKFIIEKICMQNYSYILAQDCLFNTLFVHTIQINHSNKFSMLFIDSIDMIFAPFKADDMSVFFV